MISNIYTCSATTQRRARALRAAGFRVKVTPIGLVAWEVSAW